MSAADRKAAALEQLDDLVQQGLVAKGSIYADEENGMVSFSYSCGALGGILLENPDEENTAADLQLARGSTADRAERHLWHRDAVLCL